ncbi:putative rare lipoprotein a -like double-psi beta-barrel domain-containing [Erysiphe neolycopersici]|uniref:Putative rare lipoprotein a-like double-psi beta-barrel domain-containing n=1 Tax=Erysiphe neolycopersici TaxID=212602 RepID=A0A420HQC1_9PEZI|nr:putative rare lipoprotein a -like double-psi beta-barrel domain-containing [Erysiphe neolycopersici]
MKAFFLVFTSTLGQIALASPHRHLHNHNHAARHVKRDDDIPVTTWVTEYASVVKTIEVTTTIWVNPSDPKPSQAIDIKQDTPANAPAFPSPIPAQFFEPNSPLNDEIVSTPSLEPAPVEMLSPAPTSTEEKIELPQQYHGAVPEKPSLIPEAVPEKPTLSPETKPEPTQQQHEGVAENVVSIPAVNEAASALSNNITTPVDHSASVGPCTAGSPCNGDITYYDPGVGAGACGWQNTKDEPVVALPHAFMGEKSNGNPYCGKTITIVHNGKTSTARVVDKCMGCSGFSIDLSDSVFTQLAALSVGRTSAKWWIN